MADPAVLKEYLVSLGWKLDREGMREVENTLARMRQQVDSFGLPWARAAAIVSASFATMGASLAAFTDKLAQADLSYQKFALRMFTDTQTARRMKVATETLGESLEDIAWIPELRGRYKQLMGEGRAMEPGKDYQNQMRYMRDVRFEFTRLQQEMIYGSQWIGSYLIKYLAGPIGGLDQGMKKLNDWLQVHMPEWTEKVARFLTVVMNLGRSAWRAMEDLGGAIAKLWAGMSAGERAAALAAGALWVFSKMGPLGQAIAMIGAAIVAIEDFYAYIGGDKSAKTLAPIWHHLLAAIKPLKDIFNDVTDSIRTLMDALLGIKGGGWVDTLDEIMFNLSQAAHWTKIVLMGLKAQLYKGSSDEDTRAYAQAQEDAIATEKLIMEKEKKRHQHEMSLSPEERYKVRQRMDQRSAFGTPPSGASGDRMAQGMSYFMSQGYTREQAAGIMGNLYHESGGLQPGIEERGREGKGGFGLAQWTGPRRTQFFKWAAESGQNPYDYNTQLSFVNWELNNTEGGAKKALLAAKSTPEATRAFMDAYERPGIPHYDSRLQAANQAAGSVTINQGAITVNVPQTNATAEDIAKAVADKVGEQNRMTISRQMRELAGGYA